MGAGLLLEKNLLIVYSDYLGLVPRQALTGKILSREEPVILINAVAGMGKSCLLAQLASQLGVEVCASVNPELHQTAQPVLWDIPPDAESASMPSTILSAGQKLIVAKRPNVDLPGLDRAGLYGQVFVIDENDLLMSEEELTAIFGGSAAARIVVQTSGWPFLVAMSNRLEVKAGAIERFLVTEIFETMSATGLVDLSLRQGSKSGRVETGSTGQEAPNAYLSAEAIRQPLKRALGVSIDRRLATPEGAKAMVAAYSVRGMTTEAILALQAGGFYGLALRAFIDASGRFYIHKHGQQEFNQVLGGFPSDYAGENEDIVMSFVMQALKNGDVPRARRILADRYGAKANNIANVFTDRSSFSVALRSFRLVMLTYEDVTVTDQLLEQVFGLLSEFRLDDHLGRGSVYNSVLEFYIRSRRVGEAREVAIRALHHYRLADVPLLCFYINLHQAIMSLMAGNAVSAVKAAGDAAINIAKVPFDSPMDKRLLSLLNACIDYEDGKPEPLARFLSVELDNFSQGEVWPSLLELALQYGSQALSEHYSTLAARRFLDRWRVCQIHNRQFRMMVELREAIILQNGNRWQEAAGKLSPIQSRINRTWVEAAVDELTRLQDRDEIALALIWLRHIVFERPVRPHLDRQLIAMLNNLYLTDRQKLCLEIWRAYVAKRQRDLTRTRAVLQKAFEHAARLGAIAPLSEEKIFLRELLDDKRIEDFLKSAAPMCDILRRLRDAGLPNASMVTRSGLSRREFRVLLMISEGASNKFIAHALGLSEATVKFHLGNLYRKLDCAKRREAISAAKALGLIS